MANASDPLSTEQVEEYWKILGELKARLPLLVLVLKRLTERAATAERHKRILRDVAEQCRMDRSSPEVAKRPVNATDLRVVSSVIDCLNRRSSSGPRPAGASPGAMPNPGNSNSHEAGAQRTKRAQPEQQQKQLRHGVGGGEGGAGPSGLSAAGGAQQGAEDMDGERPGKLPRLASGNVEEVQDGANQGRYFRRLRLYEHAPPQLGEEEEGRRQATCMGRLCGVSPIRGPRDTALSKVSTRANC